MNYYLFTNITYFTNKKKILENKYYTIFLYNVQNCISKIRIIICNSHNCN